MAVFFLRQTAPSVHMAINYATTERKLKKTAWISDTVFILATDNSTENLPSCRTFYAKKRALEIKILQYFYWLIVLYLSFWFTLQRQITSF